MSQPRYFLTVLLVFFWAALSQATLPPSTFPVPLNFVPPPGWKIVARRIARNAQAVEDMSGRSPAHEWLFDPRDDTFDRKRRYLESYKGMLDVLKRRQAKLETTPQSLTPVMRLRLQEELDDFLYTCVWRLLYESERNPNLEIDIPETARQCEAEFKVTFGVDEAGKKYEMQGILNDDNGAIQRLLDRNYVLCRDKDHTKDYCVTKTTIKVNGKERMAEPGFRFQAPSPGDLLRDVGRSVTRYFFDPGQPAKKKPTAVFLGGAQPRPFFFRPH